MYNEQVSEIETECVYVMKSKLEFVNNSNNIKRVLVKVKPFQ